jgi:Trypsin
MVPRVDEEDFMPDQVFRNPLQKHGEAVLSLAQEMVGDDESRLIPVFINLMNQTDQVSLGGDKEILDFLSGKARASFADNLPSVIRPGPDTEPQPHLWTDPVLIRNVKEELVPDEGRVIGGQEVVDGQETSDHDYEDCVAIGKEDGTWGCTGTVIGKNVVLTAAHCHAKKWFSTVFIGLDVNSPEEGRVLKVERSVVHPNFDSTSLANDLCVLLLAGEAGVTPRRIASIADVNDARTVRVVGFGTTNVRGEGVLGKKRFVDIPIASTKPIYGAHPESEFVAGAPMLDRDSCRGDSGGPAYVGNQEGWFLGGATSRWTRNHVRTCGDGGIYVRVAEFEDWIKSIDGAQW